MSVGTPGQPSAWERIAPVAAAVGAGVGVVGFVTFVGGAIQYGRFAGVGVPASEAVSVVPTQTLIVVGAEAVTPAVVLGLVYSALLFVGRVRDRPEEVPRGRDSVRAALMVVYLVAFGVLAISLEGLPDDPVVAVLVVAAAALAAVVAGGVAYRTGNVLWLATVTFIVVGLLAGGVRVARAWDNEYVRGAALIRQNQKAIVGFYIAESGGRVFVGRLFFNEEGTEIDRTKSQIIGVDKDQVTDLGIGPPQGPHEALRQAWEMAKGMCSGQIPRGAQARAVTQVDVERAVNDCAGGSPVPG